MLRLAERVNTLKDAKEFIKLNRLDLHRYEIIVLWEEVDEGDGEFL